jgi:sarcosine oxidase
MGETYDAIVLGLGGMGGAAAYHLAKRGYRVLGLDAHARGHALGSSHGETRMIREAYAESPEYVPLVQRAYALWRELEAETGRDLLTITGGIGIRPEDAGSVDNQLQAAEEYGLAVETLSPDAVMARYPGFRVPSGYVGVIDPHSGFVRPEACTFAHLDLAAKHGAALRHSEPARRWAADGAGVRVETDKGTYRADRLVITAGPWAAEALADLQIPLQVWRMYNVHFASTKPELFAPERFPVWGVSVPEGSYYGFPYLDGQGVKLGRHDVGEVCTPETARREVTESEIDTLRAVLDTYLPGASGPVLQTLTCLYTMTPDHHFILDTYPGHANVAYGCGFSGHGFKFASAIGEVMAEFVTTGRPTYPVSFLSASRFASASAR